MQLSAAAIVLNAQLVGEDAAFTSVGTDSRHIEQGQLFVALKGEQFDGHAYAVQALKDGAAGVLVNEGFDGVQDLEAAIVVKDTYQALGELAAYWRSQFNAPVIGVTGSNGKTTVKEMLAAILRETNRNEGAVLATAGNLNNHIGMPLTLLKMQQQHAHAVIEMGMNHSGEIRYLTNIAKPNVVLINNAGNAHLGELGSYEAIAKAKGEIIEGLADDGVVVLNQDDAFYPLWKALAGTHKTMTFGLNEGADVNAHYQLNPSDSEIKLNAKVGDADVKLAAPGLHNVMNALAATTAALAVGADLNAVKQGLEKFAGAKGRLQYKQGMHGAVVIDDSYNANPMSTNAAIDVLKAYDGKQVLVLGDMGELGTDAVKMHQEAGAYAKAAGIHQLLTLGELTKEVVKTFGQGATHFDNVETLIEQVKTVMDANTMVLVKGSRFMAMERVSNAIQTAAVEKGAH